MFVVVSIEMSNVGGLQNPIKWFDRSCPGYLVGPNRHKLLRTVLALRKLAFRLAELA